MLTDNYILYIFGFNIYSLHSPLVLTVSSLICTFDDPLE